jgi:hypothetical protein
MSDTEGDSWNLFQYIMCIKDKIIRGFLRCVSSAHVNYTLFSIALMIKRYRLIISNSLFFISNE